MAASLHPPPRFAYAPGVKLLFLGSGSFGLPTLRSLTRDHTLLAIVSQPDRPAGRGGVLTPTPIAQYAAQHLPSVPLLKPPKINDPDVVAQLRALNADAWVVIAYGQKLGRALLDGIFAINLHGSLLPRWRGAAPINAAILAGDPEVGSCVITLAERMDAGLILARKAHPSDPSLTAGELHDLLAQDGPALIEGVLSSKRPGTLRAEPQDESRVTVAPKLSKADAWVDFRQPAEECRRRVHGLNPWPGITVSFRGQPLKLVRVRPEQLSGDAREPGTIQDLPSGLVACGNSTTLRILEVLPPGRRQMPWTDFARGLRASATADRLIGRES